MNGGSCGLRCLYFVCCSNVKALKGVEMSDQKERDECSSESESVLVLLPSRFSHTRNFLWYFWCRLKHRKNLIYNKHKLRNTI